MSKARTEHVSSLDSGDPKEFRGHMGATATAIFDRAIDASVASERRIAAALGYSSEHLRHLRGDVNDHEAPKHVQFRDIVALLDVAPDAYRHVLSALAERAGLVVVEKIDGAKQAAIIDHAIAVTKEGNEASAALLDAVKSSDPATLRNAIKQLEESSQADHAAISLLKSLLTDHDAKVAARLAGARGGLA